MVDLTVNLVKDHEIVATMTVATLSYKNALKRANKYAEFCEKGDVKFDFVEITMGMKVTSNG